MTLLENTPAARVLHPELKARQWQPGQSGNPSGRPQGSRNKLTEAFVAKMLRDFQQHGDTVIERVREKNPTAYLACVAALVPKQKQELHSPFGDLSDEELEQLERFLKASRAKNITPARGNTEQSLNTSPTIEQSE